jgi:prolyl-tRNA editing enzyme YbaK/EbsC (Cys-tRNA(Pro) deacylase)
MDETERRVRELVAAMDVPGVRMIDCDPALADTAAFCEAYGYAPEDSANAIVVVGKTDPPRFVMCVVLSNTRLDVNRAVRQRLGVKRASFASAEQTMQLTGMAIGGVTPIGVPPGMPLWIDARVMSRAEIVVGGGSRSCKVVGPPAFLTALPGAEVVEALAVPFGDSDATDPTDATDATDATDRTP